MVCLHYRSANPFASIPAAISGRPNGSLGKAVSIRSKQYDGDWPLLQHSLTGTLPIVQRALFGSQRGHRADARGTTGREPGSDERGGGEQGGRDGKGDWIQRADFVEHSAQNFSSSSGQQ
jgi:hypothetical protein